ncbi:acyltransferase family protein [Compostimonas suwonensis]|uniref:Peptidoglycan/LPS O-acetylase OafA/YrhL n=1 Tax=Compostimonas suwonensis TaxID=1048394 RepID=A0A2M9BV57_9MICO|nr:acyltransferase family protein [Compostimonas suwonensis]PJJ61833.1 peptidoglycan/LPS O-acetylase OafA/YrhL [Compostimonas suwonensis]
MTTQTDSPAPAPTATAAALSDARAGRPRYAGLDGLRALAVIAVVVYHLFPGFLPGGFIGVDVFFVVSGFLITSLLIDERVRTGRVALRSFWWRRFLRLVPAIGVLLLVCCTFAWVVGGDVLVGLDWQVLGAATFSYNWLAIASDGSYFALTAPELFRNLWSLAVEEQFYVLWPLALLLLLLLRRDGGRRRSVITLIVVVGLAVASAAAMWLLYVPGTDATRVYFGTETHSFGLMLGAALALAHSSQLPRDPARARRLLPVIERWSPVIGIAALLGLVTFAALLHDTATFTYHGGLPIVSVLTVVLIWSGIQSGRRLGRWLDVAPLRYLGERSYGLYLWHWPVFVIVAAVLPALPGTPRSVLVGVLTLVVFVPVAFLSYRYIERPIRRLGFREAARRAMAPVRSARVRRRIVAGVAVVVTLLLAGSAAALASAPRVSSAQQNIERGLAALASPGPTQAPAVTETPAPPADADPAPTTPPEPAAPNAPTDPTTPPAPPAPAVTIPSGDQITAIGDSVMLASAPELQSTFPGIAIDATVSRQFSEAPDIVQALSDQGALRPVILIGLGTNGLVSNDGLERIRAIAGPDREIVLVNAFAPRDWVPVVNQTLGNFDIAYTNVACADWSTAIAGHLDLLSEDQIHPGPTGGQIYANAVSDALARLAQEKQHAAPLDAFTPSTAG